MLPGVLHAYLLGDVQGVLNLAEKRFGHLGFIRLQAWLREAQELARTQDAAPIHLLVAVNRLANQIPYVEDNAHWGFEEYWATPVEFVASNGGDCDDYAIAKYFLLRELGFAPQRLRLTYVQALVDQKLVNHMVLAYYPTPEADPLVLDNLNPRVLPAAKRRDLIPVYTFNDEAIWKVNNNVQERVGKSSQLKRWDDLIRRIRAEEAAK